MNASDFVAKIVRPSQAWMISVLGPTPLWTPANTDRALVMLTAIAGQESDWTARIQGGAGPAHSFWQDEGGAHELLDSVLTGSATKAWATSLCGAVPVVASRVPVWELFATPAGDMLAGSVARLALWADPAPLPEVGAMDDAYDCYLRLWQPGKPSEARWEDVYPRVVAAVVPQMPNP